MIISPAAIGATLPGRERDQTVEMPRDRAASKSIPPGFDARSINRAPGFAAASSFPPITGAGTVLKIISKRPMISEILSVWQGVCPFAEIQAISLYFLALTLT